MFRLFSDYDFKMNLFIILFAFAETDEVANRSARRQSSREALRDLRHSVATILVSIDSSEEPVVVRAILGKAHRWVLELVLNPKDVPPNSNAMDEFFIRFWLLMSHVRCLRECCEMCAANFFGARPRTTSTPPPPQPE